MVSRQLAYGVLPGVLGEKKTKRKLGKPRMLMSVSPFSPAGLSVMAVLGQVEATTHVA